MLPKLNTDNLTVREYIFDVAEYWIKFGIDGWRLDVPNDIDDDEFWREFRKRVKKVNPEAYIVGEIWTEADRWLQGDQFDAVMNYLLGKEILQVSMNKLPPADVVTRSHFAQHKPISALEFSKRAQRALNRYHPNIVSAQLNLLTSHDTPRLASIFHDDEAGMRLAFSLLFALPGAPCVFYGDEIAMLGKHDPDCRRAFPSNLDKHLAEHPIAERILEHIKELSSVRSAYESIRRGSTEFFSTRNLIAFARVLRGHPSVLVIANPTGKSTTQEMKSPIKVTSKQRVQMLFGEGHIEQIETAIQVTIPARSISFALISN
jgi:glycosidase